jgi:hypothetical protein
MISGPELGAFVTAAAADDRVLAVLLAGSRAHGVEDERSDYDVCVVATERLPREQRGDLDIAYWTLEDLEPVGWWTPGVVYAKVLLDKTGTLPALLERLSRAAAGDPAAHYDAYLNSFVRSTRAWERGDELGARIHAAESLAWLAKTLFALDGRVAPYHDRLFVHLDREWLPAFREIARSADTAAQRALQDRVQALMEAHGIRAHDEWGRELRRAKGGDAGTPPPRAV